MPDDALPLGNAPAPSEDDAPGNAARSSRTGQEEGEARYLVTARKYRPALFGELVAQDHVTDTLKNALRTGRLAHAYLFSGPRGVGKTTAARILAKAINCTTPLEERADDAEPCRACESCRSFEEGRSLGIFELDAASNNKVDDIRELRETVRVPPQGTKKKVYIVDEVHMLSNQAFNALLKTLEEPPPHVLFIFATTEPHKVLPTILSRCQRFDFRRVPAGRIARHLRWICQEEGVDADAESLMLLARKGDGALRDALSAFDQAVSLCGDTLRHDELAEALGVVDADLFFQATGHVQNGAKGRMLHLVEEVVERGYDLQEFLAGLSEHLRNLMVARSTEEPALIEATDAMRERYAETAPHFGEDDLLRLLMVAGEAEEDVRQSGQPRLRLELALLKMAALPRAADLQEALSLLHRLEARADAGELPQTVLASSNADEVEQPPPGDAPAASPSPSPREANEPEADEPEADEPEADAVGASPGAPSPNAATAPVEAGGGSQDGAASLPEPALSEQPSPASDASADAPSSDASSDAPSSNAAESEEDAPRLGGAPPSDGRPDEEHAGEERSGGNAPGDSDGSEYAFADLNPDAPDDDAPGGGTDRAVPSQRGPSGNEGAAAPPEYDDLFGAPALSREDTRPENGGEGSPQDTAAEEADSSAGGSNAAPAAALASRDASGDGAPSVSGRAAPDTLPATVQKLRTHWDALVQDVRTDRIDLASCLSDAVPVALSAGTLTVAVPNQFSRRFLLDQEAFLLGHVERHLPERVAVPSALHLTLDASPSDDGDADGDAPADPHAVMQELRESHPVVQTIFEEFGGEMAW